MNKTASFYPYTTQPKTAAGGTLSSLSSSSSLPPFSMLCGRPIPR
uniref:Uncharacterized protein n=1 Tax=Rhizophora mucronata TaxID=61149 RepID=A0A2P2J2F6_RHIMU